jgi:hypothetical protein
MFAFIVIIETLSHETEIEVHAGNEEGVRQIIQRNYPDAVITKISPAIRTRKKC